MKSKSEALRKQKKEVHREIRAIRANINPKKEKHMPLRG